MSFDVFRVTPIPGDGAPVTAWAGPSSGAAQAVRVAARVLRLPPGMRVEVEGQRVSGGKAEWELISTTTVEAAITGSR